MYQFFTTEILGFPAETANLIATIVLALLALILLYLLYRLISRPRLASGRRSKHARLAITDAASVDDRRKLVLVRRDDVEHLVMIGGSNDLVIEEDIRRNQPIKPAAPATPAEPARATRPASARPVAPTATPAVATPTAAAPVRPTPAVQPATTPVAPVKSEPATASLSMPTVGAGIAGAAAVAGGAVSAAAGKTTAVFEASVDKAGQTTEQVKNTVSDDMDALLSEITADK